MWRWADGTGCWDHHKNRQQTGFLDLVPRPVTLTLALTRISCACGYRYFLTISGHPIGYIALQTPCTPSEDGNPYPSRSYLLDFTDIISDKKSLHPQRSILRSALAWDLRRCGGNRRSATRVLGIARNSLYGYLKRFGIEGDNPHAD
jgi:hypothetical protein